MTAEPHDCDAILVRCSPEIVAHMKVGDVEPVVILGVEEQADGTYDMTLKTPDVVAENRRLREQHERDLIQVREAHEARRIAEFDAVVPVRELREENARLRAQLANVDPFGTESAPW